MKKILLPFVMIACIATQTDAQGAYIEFKMSTGQAGMTGSSKVYSRDGNTRSEVTMSSPQMPAGLNRATLILKDNPNKAYQLNVAAKTYTEFDLTNVTKTEDDPADFDVTVIGKEKVNGYNTTHIKMKRKSQPTEIEAWLSADILNYKQYASVKSKYTSRGFYKALEDKGVAGFPVRMMVAEHGNTVQMDLVKAEMRNNDASLFSLEGYKMAGSPAGASGSQMSPSEQMKRIQNMTPEERQQFVDQLRQRQQEATTPKQ